MKKQLLAVSLITALSACGGSDNGSGNNTNGASPSSTGVGTIMQPSAPAPMTDKDMLVNAYQDGQAEIQLSQLALQKSANPAVRDFAQRMINDHTTLNTEIARIAGTTGIALPTTLSTDQQTAMANLSALSGTAFDQAYMDMNVTTHQHDVAQASVQLMQMFGINSTSGTGTASLTGSNTTSGGTMTGTGSAGSTGTGALATGQGTLSDAQRITMLAQPVLQLHLMHAEELDGAVNPPMYLAQAYRDGLMEIQASQLALQASGNSTVRTFAQSMIDQHTALNAQLAQLAQAKGIQLPTVLSEDQLVDLADLGRFSGNDFDRAYMDMNVTTHTTDAAAASQQSQQGSDPDIKAQATAMLPQLQQHLTDASSIDQGITPSLPYGAMQGELAADDEAELAILRSGNVNVRSYAQGILSNQQTGLLQIAAQGQAASIPVPITLPPAQLAALDSSLTAGDTTFERTWIDAFIASLVARMGLLDAQLGISSNTQFATFGQALLANLQMQQSQAMTVQAGIPAP